MTKAALTRITVSQVSGTAPSGMQAHPVPAGLVLLKGLFMTLSTDLGINKGLA